MNLDMTANLPGSINVCVRYSDDVSLHLSQYYMDLVQTNFVIFRALQTSYAYLCAITFRAAPKLKYPLAHRLCLLIVHGILKENVTSAKSV